MEKSLNNFKYTILGSIVITFMIFKVCQANDRMDISYNVTVTMYNPVSEQTDSTPNELADGTIINPNKASKYRYVALSRDLLSRWGGNFNYGDFIVIEGVGKDSGIYQVRDTMNPRYTLCVDILKTSGSSQFKYTNVIIYKHKQSTEVE
tara:strand:- start:4696 stop:5142 length:447 start_codon:yes stop_codon:yes gene_type:complete